MLPGTSLGPRVLELCSEDLQSYGIELLAVDLKDIMFPGDLKRTFAQVVNARKEGQAALEKARGETAALRNLANAAGLMRDNPMLLQIRLMQQIGSSSGNTVVVGFPPGVTPVPGKAQSEGDRIQSGPERASSPSPNLVRLVPLCGTRRTTFHYSVGAGRCLKWGIQDLALSLSGRN